MTKNSVPVLELVAALQNLKAAYDGFDRTDVTTTALRDAAKQVLDAQDQAESSGPTTSIVTLNDAGTHVVVAFGRSLQWISFDPRQAHHMGAVLIQHAKMIEQLAAAANAAVRH